jgi:hypothetical protein
LNTEVSSQESGVRSQQESGIERQKKTSPRQVGP